MNIDIDKDHLSLAINALYHADDPEGVNRYLSIVKAGIGRNQYEVLDSLDFLRAVRSTLSAYEHWCRNYDREALEQPDWSLIAHILASGMMGD